MAFDYTNLYPDTSGNGGYTKSWNYTTVVDNIATCSASGYFNKVATRLGIGDNIVVAQVDAFDKTRTALIDYATLYVTGISGGVVTTLNSRAALAPSASPAFTGIPTAPTAAPGNNSTQLATTAYADAIAALKANVASPALTGSPTAPTATAGTNTTQIATTAYADAIAALKANVASPTFTGTPAAPTAAVDTNTTQVATTAMVLAQAASATPLINGTAAVGTSTRFARGDHVHPTDTSRAPLALLAWTNARLAKTAAYTVVNADKASTIALGGTAFYALTFNAPSGYDANFAVMVVNEDTTRGKSILLNGGGSFILWPGQSCTIFNQNNIWRVNPMVQRWAVGGLNVYVDSVNGNDANDGLAAGTGNALATINRAVLLLYLNIDCLNGAPTIHLAAGTFTESVTLQGQLTGVNYFLFSGAGSASTTWKPGASGYCLNIGDNAECQVQAMKFDNTGGAANCVGIGIHQTAVVDVLTDINFGTFPGTVSRHINSDQGGFINMPASYTISGAATWHMNIGPNTVVGQSSGGTITFSGTFTLSILYRLTGCFMYFSGVATYALGTATITQSYSADFLTALQLNGTTVPGGAGSVTHGSQAA